MSEYQQQTAPQVMAERPDMTEEDFSVEEDLLVEEVSIDGMCGVY